MANEYSREMIATIARGAQLARENYERELAVLREAIASKLESTSQICFEHSVTGRLHDGELKAEFRIKRYEYGEAVKGDIQTAAFEFMRREGYDHSVETKLLSRPRSVLVVNDTNQDASDDPLY